MRKEVISLLGLFLVASARADANPSLGQYAKGNQLFSVNVFKDFTKIEKGNIILSPLSARIILGLTAEGAKGDTLSEINKGLQLLQDKDENHKSVAAVTKQLHVSNDQIKLLAANRLFVNEGFKIEQSFKDIAVQVYQSGIQDVDFKKPQQAASTINNWVEDRTNHRITNLIDASQLSRGIELVLVNALYFSGKWVHPFQTFLTRSEPFYTSKTDKKPVDMMNGNIHTKYAHNDQLKAKFLNLAFKDTSVTMTIILPDAVDGLAHVEEHLGDYLAPQNYQEVEVAVSMPKFTIETKVDFIPLLKQLGIHKLFNPSQSDLSGISKEGRLYVSFVVQKAYINVTESGAEAAAATAVGASRYSVTELEHEVFKADHPFMYTIEDGDIILFAGRYNQS